MFATNNNLLPMINQLNEDPFNQGKLNRLTETLEEGSIIDQLFSRTTAPAIAHLDLELAPHVWENFTSRHTKLSFIIGLFQHLISENNQHSRGALKFLNYLTNDETHYSAGPSDGRLMLRNGTTTDDNGYDSDGNHYSWSDEEVENYQSYSGPSDEMSEGQQRVLGYITRYSKYVNELLPDNNGDINRLAPHKIKDWLDSAHRLHFCALMCFANQQGTGMFYVPPDNNVPSELNQIIQGYVPIPSPLIADEANLSRHGDGFRECTSLLHMYAKEPFELSNSSGAEIIAHTFEMIKLIHRTLLERNDLTPETRQQLTASISRSVSH